LKKKEQPLTNYEHMLIIGGNGEILNGKATELQAGGFHAPK
jgi:hypothetical protein